MFIRLYYYHNEAPCGLRAMRYGKRSICSCISYPQVITIQICLHQFTVYCVLWFAVCTTLLNALCGLVRLSLREVLSDESCKLSRARCCTREANVVFTRGERRDSAHLSASGTSVSCALRDRSERPPWHLHIWGAICLQDRQARANTAQTTSWHLEHSASEQTARQQQQILEYA